MFKGTKVYAYEDPTEMPSFDYALWKDIFNNVLDIKNEIMKSVNRPVIMFEGATFKFTRNKRFNCQTCKSAPYSTTCTRGVILSIFNGVIRYMVTVKHCAKSEQRRRSITVAKAAAQRERKEIQQKEKSKNLQKPKSPTK